MSPLFYNTPKVSAARGWPQVPLVLPGGTLGWAGWRLTGSSTLQRCPGALALPWDFWPVLQCVGGRGEERWVCAAWEKERSEGGSHRCRQLWFWREAEAGLSWEVPRDKMRSSGTQGKFQLDTRKNISPQWWLGSGTGPGEGGTVAKRRGAVTTFGGLQPLAGASPEQPARRWPSCEQDWTKTP